MALASLLGSVLVGSAVAKRNDPETLRFVHECPQGWETACPCEPAASMTIALPFSLQFTQRVGVKIKYDQPNVLRDRLEFPPPPVRQGQFRI